MMVKVTTPKGAQGYICGFSVAPSKHIGQGASKHVLVAIEGKSGNGKLEVYAPSALKVVFVEPEMP